MNPERILVAVPCGSSLSPHTATMLQHIRDENPGLQPILYQTGRLSSADTRHRIVRALLEGGCDALVMVDSDVIPQPNLLQLASDLDEGYAVVGAPCLVSVADGNMPFPVVYRWDEESNGFWPIDGLYSHTGLVECDGVGFGCVAISRAAIEAVGPAPFAFDHDEDGIIEWTEDLAFCRRLRKLGMKVGADYRCFVDHMPIVSLNLLAQQYGAIAQKAAQGGGWLAGGILLG